MIESKNKSEKKLPVGVIEGEHDLYESCLDAVERARTDVSKPPSNPYGMNRNLPKSTLKGM